jgi:AbrB family looped-hinge helix DNA binding protein
MSRATLTSKGQITIPKEVRERLHLGAGDQVDFQLLENGSIQLRSCSRKASEVFGILRRKGERPLSTSEMYRHLQKAFRKRK